MTTIAGTTIGADWHALIFALATRSYNSLVVADRAVRDGFPLRAMILPRAVYEDIQTADYIHTYIHAESTGGQFWIDRRESRSGGAQLRGCRSR